MNFLSKRNVATSVAGLSILFIASFLLTHSSYATPPPTDLLPDLRPVQADLMDYDLVKDPNTGQILLRFTGSLGNYGDGTLQVFGQRTTVDLNDNEMPAYQRIYSTDGSHHDELVGTLIYHPAHHHYHFSDAMEYALKDGDNVIVTSAKQSFCLADVGQVGTDLPNFSHVPVYNRCYHAPRATFVEMGISVGWSDVYDKRLVGQALDVTDLMQLPKHTYTLEATSNPDGALIEKNATPQKASIQVELGEDVPVGVGKSRPGV